jgi:putative nucleotidyltransferase with HDIG domain
MPEDIEQIILKTCDLPTMPVVAEKVMMLVADPDATTEQLQKVISADQALAARILKIANSAFYASVRKINTISEAVVIIGFNTLRSIVLTASSREIYKRFGLTEKMLWEHSMGAAISAGVIAKDLKLPNQEEAYLGGLLHDVGKVVLDNSDPQKFADVMEMVYNEQMSFRMAEQEVYGFSHVDVGAMVIRKWKLSENLEMAVRHQYNPKWLSMDPNLMKLTAVVNLANQFCLRLGIGHRKPVEDLPLEKEEAFEILQMKADRLPMLLELTAKAYEEERRFFQ